MNGMVGMMGIMGIMGMVGMMGMMFLEVEPAETGQLVTSSIYYYSAFSSWRRWR